MKTSAIALAVALLATLVAGCGGPDLGSPEGCARSYQTAVQEQQNAEADEWLAKTKWELDCAEASLGWYADKSEHEKELKSARAQYEFTKDNLSALKKYEIDIVGVEEQKDGDKVVGKLVKMKIKGKRPQKKGDSGTEFELKDSDHTSALLCTQIEGKWKIKRGE